MNLTWLKYKGKVKGIFSPPIPYTPVLESGDSSPYFGNYEGQKYGAFDTDCCWDFSAAECAETRLELYWKLGLIPPETKLWLTQNGYIDQDGDFYLSRRWVAILNGTRDSGASPLDFWNIAQGAGLIPNWMLPYNSAEAAKWITKDQFNNDYFNPQIITMEMELMGLEFAKRFKIRAQNIPGGSLNQISTEIQTYLKEGSLQIGHPVPQDGRWNQTLVPYPYGRTVSDHATELYKFDESQPYPFYIYDSYEPHLKQLQRDYYIPLITRVSIIPVSTVPVVVPMASWTKFWQNVCAWITGNPLPFPNVQVGST